MQDPNQPSVRSIDVAAVKSQVGEVQNGVHIGPASRRGLVVSLHHGSHWFLVEDPFFYRYHELRVYGARIRPSEQVQLETNLYLSYPLEKQLADFNKGIAIFCKSQNSFSKALRLVNLTFKPPVEITTRYVQQNIWPNIECNLAVERSTVI